MLEDLAIGLGVGAMLGIAAGFPLGLGFYCEKKRLRQAWTTGAIIAVLAGSFAMTGHLEQDRALEVEPAGRSEAWFFFGRAVGLSLALTGWGTCLRSKYAGLLESEGKENKR